MKSIPIAFKWIAVLALMALAAGCATKPHTTQSKVNLLIAAGFKVLTPSTPDQLEVIRSLAPGKVTAIHKDGKPYYVVPVSAQNKLFVGGPKQYNAYKTLQTERNTKDLNIDAGEMNQTGAPDWGDWGGWGKWRDYGWY
jgi:hypothetical protein